MSYLLGQCPSVLCLQLRVAMCVWCSRQGSKSPHCLTGVAWTMSLPCVRIDRLAAAMQFRLIIQCWTKCFACVSLVYIVQVIRLGSMIHAMHVCAVRWMSIISFSLSLSLPLLTLFQMSSHYHYFSDDNITWVPVVSTLSKPLVISLSPPSLSPSLTLCVVVWVFVCSRPHLPFLLWQPLQPPASSLQPWAVRECTKPSPNALW